MKPDQIIEENIAVNKKIILDNEKIINEKINADESTIKQVEEAKLKTEKEGDVN